MSLHRVALFTAWMFLASAGSAAAQAPWPQPGGQQAATSPWPAPAQPTAPSPWSAPPQQMQPTGPSPWSAQPQQPPPCVQEFFKLRDQAEKRVAAIRAASARHATPQEACGLFNAFSAAETRMLKYATEHATSCGIPPDVIANLKKGHAQTSEIRTKVCQAAARPAGPAAPSLSDALTAPVPDSKNIKSGGGTFDTLTGTALGRQ